jgi:hypothetical protein
MHPKEALPRVIVLLEEPDEGTRFLLLYGGADLISFPHAILLLVLFYQTVTSRHPPPPAVSDLQDNDPQNS